MKQRFYSLLLQIKKNAGGLSLKKENFHYILFICKKHMSQTYCLLSTVTDQQSFNVNPTAEFPEATVLVLHDLYFWPFFLLSIQIINYQNIN